jgi:hypothetical protein
VDLVGKQRPQGADGRGSAGGSQGDETSDGGLLDGRVLLTEERCFEGAKKDVSSLGCWWER